MKQIPATLIISTLLHILCVKLDVSADGAIIGGQLTLLRLSEPGLLSNAATLCFAGLCNEYRCTSVSGGDGRKHKPQDTPPIIVLDSSSGPSPSPSHAAKISKKKQKKKKKIDPELMKNILRKPLKN